MYVLIGVTMLNMPDVIMFSRDLKAIKKRLFDSSNHRHKRFFKASTGVHILIRSWLQSVGVDSVVVDDLISKLTIQRAK
jgi:hypothetical protein